MKAHVSSTWGRLGGARGGGGLASGLTHEALMPHVGQQSVGAGLTDLTPPARAMTLDPCHAIRTGSVKSFYIALAL